MSEPLRTVLVTGGAGFIGSALVRRLVADGRTRVVNLDALTYAGNLDSLAPIAGDANHVFVHGDVADADALRRLFARHRPDAIVHLAAESHVDRSIDAPAAFVRTNVLGTYTLLEEALRHWQSLDADARSRFRVLHVSTDEVFGSLGATGRFTESSPARPSSPYAATKAAADHLARAWHLTYGLPVLTSNCTNNFGPFQFPEKLIPLVVRNALAGRTLPVYGSGEQVRDWLYVEDHVDALLAILDRGAPGETYVVGGGAERRNIDVVRAICALVDEIAPSPDGPRERLIAHVPDRPGHDHRYAVDARKIASTLGWHPRHSVENALRTTVAWYAGNGGWIDRVLSGAYRGDRLGLEVMRA